MNSTNQAEFTIQKASESWALINKAIDKIYDKQSSKLSYEELYRNVYYLALNKYGDFAYNNLESSLERNLQKIHDRINCSLNNENLLKNLSSIWQDTKAMIKAIRDIFLYLEKNHIPNKKLTPIIIKAYQIFKRIIFDSDGYLYKKILTEALQQVKNEREGKKIDRISLKNLSLMLIELGLTYSKQSKKTYSSSNEIFLETYCKEIYRNLFENHLLKDTDDFYRNEAQQNIITSTCSEYLGLCFKRYQEEKDRVEACFDKDTMKPLLNVFFANYIEPYAKTLLDMESSGLAFLLNNEKFEELHILYFLFSCNEKAFDLLKKTISDFIINFCEQKQNENKISKENEKNIHNSNLLLIENIIKFRKKMLFFQEKSFNSSYDADNEKTHNKSMQKTIKEAFVTGFNNNSKITIALNYFIDYYFVCGCKNKKDHEVDNDLNDLFDIFKLLTNKDVFQTHYKQLLMKRLIDSISLNWEIENSLILKFKTECGNYYTNKISAMFNDINISNQLMQEFKEKHKEKLNEIDLEVYIVTKGKWPFKEEDLEGCQYPEELLKLQKLYENFYLKKQQGRLISWLPKYGYTCIKGFFKAGKKEFIVNTYMAVILILFNKKKLITFEEIKTLTKIPNETSLKSNIKALMDFKLLIKTGDHEYIFEKDSFKVNQDFTHNNYKNKIMVKKRNTDMLEKQEIAINENMWIERKFVIEATIIRIMKARKKMEHSNLIEETMKLCQIQHFSPSVSLIKSCIENLINKDYLERGKEINWYSYVS